MKKYMNIESDGTGIERDGTGIERDGTGIERDGTGIERDGTGIERDGTGIRRLSIVSSMCLALGMVSSLAIAGPENLQVTRHNNTITVSWFNNGELYVGRGTANGGQTAIALSKVPFNNPYFNVEVAGDGTGNNTTVIGDGTGNNTKVAGDGTGNNTTVVGDGTGNNTTVVGDGTGNNTTVIGDGTGNNTTVIGDGTGNNTTVIGDGTGDNTTVIGDGTGTNTNGQFSFMVEINLGCQSTQATIYETGNFAAVEYIELNQASISAGACNRIPQPINGRFNR